MPRMPRDPGDRFNFAEKALAGPISKSAFQHLTGMSPSLLPDGPDIRIVKRLAMIGAAMGAGASLVASARIISALSREFDDGEPPSGLEEVARKMVTPEELKAILPSEPNDYWYHRAILHAECRELRDILTRAEGKLVVVDGAELKSDDYWEHVGRIYERGDYHPGLVPALPSDIRIEICDRRHVFMWPTSRLKTFAEDSAWAREFRERHPLRPGTELPQSPGFVGWIENWERDTEMRFKHVSEEIQINPADEPHKSRIAHLKRVYGEEKYREWYGDDDSDENWRGNAARLQAQAEQEVLPNATGRMVVNVSLAIRRALDRIAEHRWVILRKRDAAKQRRAEARP